MLAHCFLVSALPMEVVARIASVAANMRDAAHRERGRKMPTSDWMAMEMRYHRETRTESLPLLVYLVGLPLYAGCFVYSEPDREVMHAFRGQGDVPHQLISAEPPRFAEQYERMLKEPTCDIDVAMTSACEYFERALSNRAAQPLAADSPLLRPAAPPRALSPAGL